MSKLPAEPGLIFPKHIAIIPDGNGRWSKKRKFNIGQGHRQGVAVIENILDHCREIGIPYVSIYAFSSENWSRPEAEKKFLFNLIEEFFTKKIPKIIEKEARIKIIGDVDRFSENIKRVLSQAELASEHNNKFLIQIALSYGGRDELVRGFKRMLKAAKNNEFDPDTLTEENLKCYLDTGSIPDPDFLIRTGGVFRTSNFLLYQMSYTEYYFSDILWPDFTVDEFKKALRAFSERERRYGGRLG